jgi:SAM-dependent methyltransferase
LLDNGERQVAPELSGIRRDHLARYRWAVRQLPAGSRVLDCACGVGYGAFILANAFHRVTAVDNNAEAIAYGRAHYASDRIDYFIGDAAELEGIELGQFDAVTSFETIEHLADPLPMLKAFRAAAPNLMASVPNEEKFPYRGYAFHHRHYTRAEFQELLAEAGWQVTGWYGQEGPESDVGAGVNGRTAIVTAMRAEAESASFETAASRPPQDEAAAEVVPEHVAILGVGPSLTAYLEIAKRLGGRRAYCDETWGINAVGGVISCDRVFHMDDLKVQEARSQAAPQGNIARMVDWLRTHPGPVYTSRRREGYPGLVEFPLEAVLNGGYDGNGGAPYFNSTAAYAVAYAIHIGVKRISAFGIDFTLPNMHSGERGRACVEFWLGIAAARGIEITVPETSTLLDACAPDGERLYGYDCTDVRFAEDATGHLRVIFEERETIPSAAEIERRYDHSRHPNRLLAGDHEES